MNKPRVLITDEELFVANNLAECMQRNFDVLVCTDSRKLLELVCDFEPDVLILDLCLPGCNAFELICTIRATGRNIAVITTTRLRSDSLISAIEKLGVSFCVMKPFYNEYVVNCVYTAIQEHSGYDRELEACRILASLGFQLGTNRARCVADGIMLWYRSNGNIATKQLYLELAHTYDKTATSIEKAIRDAIHHAWSRGDRNLWTAYFQKQSSVHQHCPSNEVFVARIAQCLWTQDRIRLSYKKAE